MTTKLSLTIYRLKNKMSDIVIKYKNLKRAKKNLI